MEITVKQILDLALSQDGYLEKASPKDEDSMTGNAGSNNYTKYGRDLAKNVGSPYSDGQPWCDCYVDWLFWKLGGKQAIMEQLYGCSAYTPTSAQYYKNNNAWYKGNSPKPCYQIFFKNSQRICHTGMVVKCENGMVYTIEGNTSSAKGVVANGGCVRQKSYSVAYSNIAGYGIPKCAAGQANTNQSTATAAKKAQANQIKDVQKSLNDNVMPGLIAENVFKSSLTVDGVYGKATRHAILAYWKQQMNKINGTTLDPCNANFGSTCRNDSLKCVLKVGDSNVFVLDAQYLLKALGYYTATLDGTFKDAMAKAVVDFEKARNLIVESPDKATVGQQVWYTLFN